MGKLQRVVITPVFTEELLAGANRRLRFRPTNPKALAASESPSATASATDRPARTVFRAA